MERKLLDFKIGADPEFRFIGINADELVRNTDAEFGHDGCSSTAEIRPKASESPLTLVQNIKNIFQSGLIKHPKTAGYVWKAGSYVDGASIGGHIHFGLGKKDLIKDMRDYRILASALDASLSPIVGLLENVEEAQSRRRQYGKLGDYREQPWGFEYRPPASWIVTPAIATGVLCLAKSLMFDAVNYPRRFQKLFPPLGETFMDRYTKCDKAYIYDKCKDVFANVKRLRQYKNFKNQINFLLDRIKYKQEWISKDLKLTWNLTIPDVKKIRKHRIDIDFLLRYNTMDRLFNALIEEFSPIRASGADNLRLNTEDAGIEDLSFMNTLVFPFEMRKMSVYGLNKRRGDVILISEGIKNCDEIITLLQSKFRMFKFTKGRMWGDSDGVGLPYSLRTCQSADLKSLIVWLVFLADNDLLKLDY